MKYPSEEILRKIVTNSLSKQEEEKIESWLVKSDKNKDLLKLLLSEYYLSIANKKEEAFEKFSEQNAFGSKQSFISIPIIYKLGIAASIIFLFGVLFFYNRKENTPEDDFQGIVLVTEDGSQINLDEVDENEFSTSNIVVDKKESTLSYSNVDVKEEIKYNMLHIPNGRTFTLILSDATIVTLNAGTKFTYPTHFGTDNRMVKLEGEAYFEVTKNTEAPFIVETTQLKTQVFGTKFNVNAYSNNYTQDVSLLEGSIGVIPKINKEETGVDLKMIKPNQQYVWNERNATYKVEKVEAKKFIDWIDGVLRFENEPLESIVKRLERKYDIEISCQNEKMMKKRFTGTFDNENLQQVLKVIQATNHFEYVVDNKKNELIIK